MASCLDYALKYIHRYPKTEFELKLQLRKKWYTDNEIQETIVQFYALNYINDEEYTKLYFSSEVEKKWKPLLKVKSLLLKKWVDRDLIERIVEENIFSLETWMKKKICSIVHTLKKRWLLWIDIIQKIQSRGYSFSLIKSAIEERNKNQERKK